MEEDASQYDVTIIGGGINGVAIAAQAAKSGFSCLLIEKSDLASLTSSSSSKLIHGGLRYLEQLDFKLVFESINARDSLLKKANFLVEPQEFIIAKNSYSRPLWYTRLGLFIYDLFSRNSSLPSARIINLEQHTELKISNKHSTSYFDAKEDDARLVVLNALDAKQHGAKILTNSQVVKYSKLDSRLWKIDLEHGNKTKLIKSKLIVNATGAYVNNVRNLITGLPPIYNLKWVKGSHLVIKKFYDHNKAFLIPCANNRIVFLIPYLSKYLLLGTTEVEIHDLSGSSTVLQSEREYLLKVVNDNFNVQFNTNDIVWEFSGTRTLIAGSKGATATSREHKIEHLSSDEHDLINIYGGKITTHENLAKQTVNIMKDLITPSLSIENKVFPGSGSIDELYEIQSKQPWITNPLLQRWINLYGTIAINFLRDIKIEGDMGIHFGHGLYEKEVKYLIDHEWAKNANDILWRRTKLGLEFSKDENKALQEWLNTRIG